MLDEKMFADLEAAARLHLMPDSMRFSTKEAAVFLRLSVRTLEDLRRSGDGPAYEQLPGGSNRPCFYEKAELLAWTGKNKVNSITDNAIRNGLLFSVASLVEEAAFWVTPSGLIMGAVENTLAADVPRLMLECDIEWLPSIEAAGSRDWIGSEPHEEFANDVQAKLSHAAAGVRAGVGRTALAETLSDAPPRRAPLID
jgi:hypothetical protein